MAVLVLALGIGANAATFTLTNALLLRPIHAESPDELVALYNKNVEKPGVYRAFSYPNFQDIRELNTAFSSVMAHDMTTVGLREGEVTRRVFAEIVTHDYFETFGVQPDRGRFFSEAEERPGSGIPVAVVSHEYWRRHGSDPDLVGRTLDVNGLLGTSVNELMAINGFNMDIVLRAAPDLRVLGATSGFCVLGTLLFGLGPAWRHSRPDVMETLEEGAGRGTAAAGGRRLLSGRNLLVVGQVALSLVLLTAAGLFTRAETDSDAGPPVAVIDELLGERLWPGRNPVGRRISLGRASEDDRGGIGVVGVVSTVRDDLFQAEPRPHVYLPFGRHFQAGANIHLRASSADPEAKAALLGSVRREIRAVDERLPILGLRTLQGHVAGSPSLWIVRMGATIFGAFGALALTGVGLAVGLLLAAGVARLLGSMLYEVSSLDPVAFLAAPLVLATASLLAT